MKKLIPFMCISIIFLTGCNSTQVRDREYIQAIELFDFDSPKISLHSFEKSDDIFSGQGDTIAAALEQAEIPIGKEVFMGHLELLCLNDPKFHEKLYDLMETYRLSPSCKVLCIDNELSLDKTDTENICDSLKRKEENGTLPKTNVLSALEESAGTDKAILLPLLTKDGFSMTILYEEKKELIQLSEEAIQGLCWLRGENYPERISVETNNTTSDFEIYNASTHFKTVMWNGAPVVNVIISLQGKGDKESAKKTIQELCKAAEQETIKLNKVDVIGLESYMKKQCYDAYQNQDWSELLHRTTFQYKIDIRS